MICEMRYTHQLLDAAAEALRKHDCIVLCELHDLLNTWLLDDTEKTALNNLFSAMIEISEHVDLLEDI